MPDQAGRTPTPDECREFDGCCITHGACFVTVHDADDQRVTCQGWPCPMSSPARVSSAAEGGADRA